MRTLFIAFACLAASAVSVAQDPLNAARELYASAAYEEALTTLARAGETGSPIGEGSERAEEYRAFCLFALGRVKEAQTIAETLLSKNPLLELESDASPRITAMFNDIRRRLLPGLIRDQYRTARTAIDGRDFAAAGPQLAQVRRMLDESDKIGVSDDTFRDLRVLVDGFSELAKNGVARSPGEGTAAAPSGQAGAAPAASAGVAPNRTAAPTAAPAASESKPFTSGMEGVVAPIVIRQDFPAMPRELSRLMTSGPKSTVLDVLIDEQGNVERAVVRQSANRIYDGLIVIAARSWKYRPALKENTPVRYLKTIEVVVNGAGEQPRPQEKP